MNLQCTRELNRNHLTLNGLRIAAREREWRLGTASDNYHYLNAEIMASFTVSLPASERFSNVKRHLQQTGRFIQRPCVSPPVLCANQIASVERKLMKLDRVESILDHEQWHDGKLPSIMLQSPIQVNLTASIMLNTVLVKSVLIKRLARHVSIVTFPLAIHRFVAGVDRRC